MKIIFLYLLGIIVIYYMISRLILNKMEGYENTNSDSDYSKTVDLPITFPFSCKNFCGPGNKCAITGEQCSNDYDCHGCENIPNLKPPKVNPYYNELSSNNEQMDYVYVGAKNNLTPFTSSYNNKIQNEWMKNFNTAIQLYNRKELANNPLTDFEKKIVPNYPTTVSATGQYYETTPPEYNYN